jgi:hypothetical protein
LPVTTVNTFANTTMAILGIRGYFHNGTGWIDLGVLENFSIDENIEDFNFQGARTGLTVTYETISISAEITYTFDSLNPLDEDILALWTGSTVTADTGGDGFSSAQTFESTTGRLLLVYENAQESKASMLVHHSSVSIKRNGQVGTPGEEARGLSFQARVLADESGAIPAGAGGGTAEYGYIWIMPSDELDAALTTAST